MDEQIPNFLPQDKRLAQDPSHPEGMGEVAVSASRDIVYGASELSRTEHELATLQNLAEQHGVAVELIPNGEAGYAVRMEKVPRVEDGQPIEHRQAWEGATSSRPIVAADADDTLFAYTETKGPRDKTFATYASNELGYRPNPDTLDTLMAMTDGFSRWPEPGTSERMYHIQSHQWALSWATQQLREVSPEDVPAKLEEIKASLAKVKTETPPQEAPFHFQNGELVLDDFVPPAEITEVFAPVYEPEAYTDAISDMQALAEEGILVAALTYGEPDFQLDKLLRLRDRLLAKDQGWPYEYIFLTRKPKGEFTEQLLQTAAQDDRLKTDLFSDDPHVFLLVDDDKKQNDNFLSAQRTVETSSGARLGTLDSLREGTKNWKRQEHVYEETPESTYIRGGAFIRGPMPEFAQLSTNAMRARDEAFSNLRLRVYRRLSKVLGDMTEDPQIAAALDEQKQHFNGASAKIERDIEQLNDLSPGSL